MPKISEQWAVFGDLFDTEMDENQRPPGDDDAPETDFKDTQVGEQKIATECDENVA